MPDFLSRQQKNNRIQSERTILLSIGRSCFHLGNNELYGRLIHFIIRPAIPNSATMSGISFIGVDRLGIVKKTAHPTCPVMPPVLVLTATVSA